MRVKNSTVYVRKCDTKCETKCETKFHCLRAKLGLASLVNIGTAVDNLFLIISLCSTASEPSSWF